MHLAHIHLTTTRTLFDSRNSCLLKYSLYETELFLSFCFELLLPVFSDQYIGYGRLRDIK